MQYALSLLYGKHEESLDTYNNNLFNASKEESYDDVGNDFINTYGSFLVSLDTLVNNMYYGFIEESIDSIENNMLRGVIKYGTGEYKQYTRQEIKKNILTFIKSQKYKSDVICQMDMSKINDLIDKLLNARILRKDEYYVHYMCYISRGYDYKKGSHEASTPITTHLTMISFGTVTNLSNFAWSDINSLCDQNEGIKFHHDTYSLAYDLNVPLRGIFINIFSLIKKLSPQTLPIEKYNNSDHGTTHYVNMYNENIWETQMELPDYSEISYSGNKCYITKHTDMFELITKILDLNKKYSMQLDYELKQKNHTFTKQKAELIKKIKSQEVEINNLKNQLLDAIPEQNRCCICFGYTDKKKVIVPCGHTQYCNTCINKLKQCALCNKNVNSIVELFGL